MDQKYKTGSNVILANGSPPDEELPAHPSEMRLIRFHICANLKRNSTRLGSVGNLATSSMRGDESMSRAVEAATLRRCSTLLPADAAMFVGTWRQ